MNFTQFLEISNMILEDFIQKNYLGDLANEAE